MKAQLRVRQNLTLELDAEQQTDLFRLLASAQEVFGEAKCGKCRSSDLQFRVRKAKGFDFYELLCTRCRAVLQFGAAKEGHTLFPRRHTEGAGGDKEWLPDNGWMRWDRDTERMV